MNSPRTRLSPGSPWITNSMYADTVPGGLAPPAPQRPRRETPAAPNAPGAGMPGVEVSELNSDTMFDRFFGPPEPAASSGAPRR